MADKTHNSTESETKLSPNLDKAPTPKIPPKQRTTKSKVNKPNSSNYKQIKITKFTTHITPYESETRDNPPSEVPPQNPEIEHSEFNSCKGKNTSFEEAD